MTDHDAGPEHTLEPPRHGHGLGHATPDGPIGIVMDLLSHAGADPGQLASIVQTFPNARDEVMSLLHQTLGAGFVREVVSRLGAPASHDEITSDRDEPVKLEELHEIACEAAPDAKPPDHEAAPQPVETPKDDGMINHILHAKSAELHGAPKTDAKHDAWQRSNHDVTSAYPPELAALYEDCLAHVRAGTLVFPKKNKKKMPPPPATSEPFERFVHAFYKHFQVKERRINIEIVAKGTKDAQAYYIRDYLESQLGAPLAAHSTHGAQRVHNKAEAAFLAMHEAAKKDGVLLKIVSGYRPPTDPTVPSTADPMAKASNSSHNYGLAIDFQLSVDKHHADKDDELRVKECDTKTMSNFMMYYGSSVSKWLVANAAKFDFHPYSMEPWHFEYNPKGMAQEILDGVKASKR